MRNFLFPGNALALCFGFCFSGVPVKLIVQQQGNFVIGFDTFGANLIPRFVISQSFGMPVQHLLFGFNTFLL
ncbi:hypothetical protein D3C87_2107920 [compost metagenome]